MAAAQAALKLRKGRRHHKNADRVRPLLADLVHTLHVDIQQDMHTLSAAPLDIALRRTVAIADIFGMLKQLIRRDHSVKRRACNEEVVRSVDLAGARGARCGGDGKAHIVAQTHQARDDGALSGARGAGDQDQLPCLVVHIISPPVSVSVASTRACTASGGSAESTAWPVSMMRTACVFRP